MKRLLFVLLSLFVAAGARAQSTSSSWVDVTNNPAGHNVSNTCSSDAGPKINLLIAAMPAGSGVLFFPAGCYLISHQILDANSSAWITYLGSGNVQLQAGTGTAAPTNSIIQFGNNSTTVTARKIENLYFNCNGDTIDGVDIDGLINSEFDDVSVYACHGTAVQTVGTNSSNWSNIFLGGLIESDGIAGSGVLIGTNAAANANGWSFYGTRIVGNNSSGTGLDFEGYGGGFYGGDVAGWSTGIGIADNNPNGGTPPQIGGFAISGSYIENNAYYGIRVGNAGSAGNKAAGVSITGNYINCNNLAHTWGVLLDQAVGFSVMNNHIRQCTGAALKGQPDATNQGADYGFVGANFIDGGQPVLLQGSNNTVTSSVSTKSANYTLSGNDSWINVTGNTTISIPHAMTAQHWDVFNSGTGNVTLQCDSGTINGLSSLPLTSQSGKAVTTDGTNCFAH
jgi:hypothetical protein